MSAHIVMTPELAIAVGELAQKHRRQSVEICWDEDRPEQLWEVRFERLDGQPDDVYIVNDESGEVVDRVS